MSDPNFDKMAATFTEKVAIAANWKQVFYGAAYSTRMNHAIRLLEEAIAEARKSSEIDK